MRDPCKEVEETRWTKRFEGCASAHRGTVCCLSIGNKNGAIHIGHNFQHLMRDEGPIIKATTEEEAITAHECASIAVARLRVANTHAHLIDFERCSKKYSYFFCKYI